jgi:hypothetical protein
MLPAGVGGSSNLEERTMMHVAEWPDDAAMTGAADRGQSWPESGGGPEPDRRSASNGTLAQNDGSDVSRWGGADTSEDSQVRRLLQSSAWQARDLDWERLVEVARGLGPNPELADLSDEDLDRRFRVQAAELAAQTCRWMELLAELVVRGVWAVPGCRTPAKWLSWTISMAPSTAREHVRIALQLRELPLIRERFREGRISFSKVRALTRVAVPEIEQMLLNWADGATAAEIERVVSGFRQAQRARSTDQQERERNRGVSQRLENDGTVTIMVRVLPEEALQVRSMIDRLVELEGSAATCDDDPEAAVEAGGSAEVSGPRDDHDAAADAVADSRRSYGAQKVDAVLNALSAAVAAGAPDTSGLDRDTLVLHMDARDLTEGEGDHGAPDDLVAVQDVHDRTRSMSRSVLRRLACDAGLVPIVLDEAGTPMDVGRRERKLTFALRRAVMVRDRSCRFPGCGSTRHLHAHHVQHWADGGPTDLANLVLICSHHHRFVHEHGWRVEPVGDGQFSFAPPGGEVLPRVLPLPDHRRASADDLIAGPGISDPFHLRPDEWPGPGYASIDLAVAVLDQELRRFLPEALTAA